jgi:hypothetical protein
MLPVKILNAALALTLAVAVLPVGEAHAILQLDDFVVCRNVLGSSVKPPPSGGGICGPDINLVLEFGVPRFTWRNNPLEPGEAVTWFTVSFQPSSIILTFTADASGKFDQANLNTLLLSEYEPLGTNLGLAIDSVDYAGPWGSMPTEDPTTSNTGLPFNNGQVRWDLGGANPSAGATATINLNFPLIEFDRPPGGIAAVATGKDGGNATFSKTLREGPINYQVCGTCPAPSVCFDDVGDPITLTGEAVRVIVSNSGVGKAKEKVTTKKIRYQYKEEGSNDLKKGIPSFVKIDMFDNAGDLDAAFACDRTTIKKSKLNVDFNIKKLKGKGKAQIDFVKNLRTSCGIDEGTFTKILGLCSVGGENKVLNVSNNGKTLKINIENGTVTGLDLEPELLPGPNP